MPHLSGLAAYFGRQQLRLVTWLCVLFTAITSPLAQIQLLVCGQFSDSDEVPGLRLVVETRLPEGKIIITRSYRLVIDMLHQLRQKPCRSVVSLVILPAPTGLGRLNQTLAIAIELDQQPYLCVLLLYHPPEVRDLLSIL